MLAPIKSHVNKKIVTKLESAFTQELKFEINPLNRFRDNCDMDGSQTHGWMIDNTWISISLALLV